MPSYVSTADIESAYLGTVALDGMYIGAEQVWPNVAGIEVGPTTMLPNSDYSYLRRPYSVWQKQTVCSIWWNSYKSRWDGVIPTITGTDAHKVTLNLTATTPTVTVQLDTRTTVRADCWWDGPNKKLYVLFGHQNADHFYRLGYNDATDVYSIEQGPTVMHGDVSISALESADGARNHDWPVILYRTPNGHLWVACVAQWKDGVQQRRVAVTRSTDNGATWATPVNLDNTTISGCCTFGHITEGGVTKIVLLANQNDESTSHAWVGFVKAWSINQDAATIAVGNWTSEPIPPAKATEWSDDHASSVTYNNKIYVAYKTTANATTDPLIGLMVRAPDTGWVSYRAIDNVPSSQIATRPGIVIDATYNRLILTWGELGTPARIMYKAVRLTELDQLITAPANVIMEGDSAGRDFQLGANLPRNTLTKDSGVLVCAADYAGLDIYRAMLTLHANG